MLNKILEKLRDLGTIFRTNNFISALPNAMGSCMAIIMVGAMAQIISSVLATLNIIESGGTIYNYIYFPYYFTSGLLGVWVTAFIGYYYAKNLGLKSPTTTGIESAVVFMMMAGFYTDGSINTSFLSTTGLFTGFICAFGVTKIEKFCLDHNVNIKMPDSCPPALVHSFKVLIPFTISVVLFQAINVGLSAISGGQMNLPILIMALLSAPLGVLTSTPGIFVLCFISLLLWTLGIHGGSITYPVIMASMAMAIQTNAELVASGQSAVFAPVLLYGAMAAVGGTGNTLALSLLCLKAKSNQLKAMGKVTIIPSFFNINEPVIFGMPIMANPIMAIPFVLNTLVVMLCFYLAYMFHIITPAWIYIVAILPVGLGSYLGTLDIRNAIFDYVCIIPSMLIWYPFFKKYDQQLLEQEQQAELEAKVEENGYEA